MVKGLVAMHVAMALSLIVLAVFYGAAWFELHPGPWAAFALSLGPMGVLVLGAALLLKRSRRPQAARGEAETHADLAEFGAELGVVSRRLFEERLGEECERSASFGLPMAVAILSVQMPGTHATREEWQAMGTAVANSAARLIRSTDIVAYLGGLEYAFCFPRTELSGTELAISRLERDLEPYSPAVGLAAFGRAGASAAELMDAARRDAIHRPVARAKTRPWDEKLVV